MAIPTTNTLKVCLDLAEVDPSIAATAAEIEIEKCPTCGGPVEHGFGLMGGGYGPYVFCDGEPPCDFLRKHGLPTDAE